MRWAAGNGIAITILGELEAAMTYVEGHHLLLGVRAINLHIAPIDRESLAALDPLAHSASVICRSLIRSCAASALPAALRSM
ncbi:hypothetical protein D3C78_1712360 [compost metagenome]